MKSVLKIVVLGMTVAVAFSLTACGGSSSSAAASASASASSASALASSASASSSAAAYDDTTTADTYTNKFFGIEYTLPNGAKFYDAAKLTELNGASYADDEVQAALEQGVEYYDAAAEMADGSTVTFSIMYATTPELKALDALDFAKGISQSTETAGATFKDAIVGTYTAGETGDDFAALKRTAEKDGQEFFQELLVVKSGDYFMIASATSQNEAALDDMLCTLGLVK